MMKTMFTLFTLLSLEAFSQENIIDKKLRLASEYRESRAKAGTNKNSGIQTVTYTVNSIGYTPYAEVGTPFLIGTDDVWSTIINIGFNFCYFGNSYNKLIVSANGQLSFDTTKASGYDGWSISSALPNTIDMPINTICGAFRDIDPALGGNSYYQLIGTSPNRIFVVSWDSIPLFDNISSTSTCGGTPNSTFQIALYESTNYIEVYIKNSFSCAQWNGGYGIVGIQDATATNAVCPPGRNYPNTWTVVNEAWRFLPLSGACFTTSANQIQKNNPVNVYPNPSINNVIIQSSTELGSIIIFNSLGEIVFETKSKNIQEQIDLSKLSSGIYTIQVQERFSKLVKE
ncbi:MAG TPA: T9SS type A sorting domain-containing protein [Bacteroidia bacterium]|jgi:hypothetical protein|nr:T9SS type A sorting domain-containing protein [Bacteroidia bacterium]